jgi:hypothetical protein
VKVIKPAYLIASFPLTQPPPGTETSAKGCIVSTETPCVASTKGWKPMMGHFQVINSLNGEFAFHNYRYKSHKYASIWLKILAKLGCLAPVLTPTFPIVRLGGKGSTSVIVTTGSSGLVPQTGWSRKLAILKDIIGRQRWKWKFRFIMDHRVRELSPN